MSFTVEKGELCVIVGHSGAGKTTLLNILGGMDTATSGHVRLDGREITGLGGRAAGTMSDSFSSSITWCRT